MFIISEIKYHKSSENINDKGIYTKEAEKAGNIWIPTYLKNLVRTNKSVQTDVASDSPTCGYKYCNVGMKDKLNVHLISHSHDDVGWIKSISEYYYDNVQFILETVTLELQEDPKKRFIYVEMAFFHPWWISLSPQKKKLVKELVNAGQLEFILGGWSMNDEASTHYSAIIDQHTVGFDFLKSTFGQCGIPKIGWQIDPFGHSREQASLFAQFGFDAFINSRIDWQDYRKRKANRNLEDMWYGSDSLEDGSPIYSHSLYRETYSHPDAFCFECGVRIKDNPEMTDYNVDEFLDVFIQHVQDQQVHFKTNHIMVMMGGDFEYQNAKVNYKNIDILIKHLSTKQGEGLNINAFYSTPSCYVKAVNDAGLQLKPYRGDYFPYSSTGDFFWTGYYTSRPSLKLHERKANAVLQACKQLHSLAQLHNTNLAFDKLTTLKRAVGVLQHHDAITGTSKFYVANQYTRMTSEAVSNCQEVIGMALNRLMSPVKPPPMPLPFLHCPLLNISLCDVTENDNKFTVVVYNPIGYPVEKYIRLPVVANNFKVLDHALKPVPWQLCKVPGSAKATSSFRVRGAAQFELVFKTLPPALGFTTYHVTTIHKESTQKINEINFNNQREISIKNEYLKLTFNGETGLLQSIFNIEASILIQATQHIMYYIPNGDGFSNSGAYVFHPVSEANHMHNTTVKARLVRGDLVDEVHQSFEQDTSLLVRLYKGAKHFEVQWSVSPEAHNGYQGKEWITRFETSLNSGAAFYTDANGRQMMRRVRDHRESWDLKSDEKISSNYYPITNRIFIQDIERDIQLTVMSDRSQGGSSLSNGQLELMINRQLFNDDSLGVDEALNDFEADGSKMVVMGTHYVSLDWIGASTHFHRTYGQQLIYQPQLSFLSDFDEQIFNDNYVTRWSGLKNRSLPEAVHLLTMEHWHNGAILLRLEHYFERNEVKNLKVPVSVSLKDLFGPFSITSVSEQALGGNQDLDQVERLRWNVKGRGQTSSKINEHMEAVRGDDFMVTLKPMQIRTFIVTLSPHNNNHNNHHNNNHPHK